MSRFWRVCWIDASNKQSLHHSFYIVAQDPEAKRAGVDGSLQATFQWLSSQRREWLLILDNADEYHDSLDESIPSGIRGNILISSRNASLQCRVRPNQAMRVGELGHGEAKQLLWSVGLSHQDSSITADMDKELDMIVQELSAIPLAIHHAATAILTGWLKVLGKWHRETLRGRVCLATCYIGQGRFEDAIAEGREALEGRENTLGYSNPDTIWTMHKLAEALEGQGRVLEVVNIWKRALELQRANQELWLTEIIEDKLTSALESAQLKKPNGDESG